ncbi:uncharacterized protein LOC115175077 isoform X2 [Salmo trutta]|uniref:uncharacterized protein LOC115175077 isoform X2 n=1 Tax=Salmo trutta TaxID=8032 RepID=UPI0011316A80|nr:uncharacterized protein LOC115175077 isoform X2 [Salmo trutta]
MKWPGVGQSSRSVHSACGKRRRAMSTLGRSKDKTWGVGLRPGIEVATLRSAWEERRLLNGFNRKLTRWFESPRLSTASISSNERAPSATPSDCSDFPSAGQRPVSLVSTLSSGSGSSRDDSPAPPPPGGTVPPTGDDIDLELNPPVGVGDQDRQHADTADPSGEGLVSRGGKFDQLNNTATPSRAASTRHTPPLSPFAAITMAPNPKITYLDRVVMEIIETERMYVRDLRSIVEKRHPLREGRWRADGVAVLGCLPMTGGLSPHNHLNRSRDGPSPISTPPLSSQSHDWSKLKARRKQKGQREVSLKDNLRFTVCCV